MDWADGRAGALGGRAAGRAGQGDGRASKRHAGERAGGQAHGPNSRRAGTGELNKGGSGKGRKKNEGN